MTQQNDSTSEESSSDEADDSDADPNYQPESNIKRKPFLKRKQKESVSCEKKKPSLTVKMMIGVNL